MLNRCRARTPAPNIYSHFKEFLDDIAKQQQRKPRRRRRTTRHRRNKTYQHSVSFVPYAVLAKRVVQAELDHLKVTTAAGEHVDADRSADHDRYGEISVAESDKIVLAL